MRFAVLVVCWLGLTVVSIAAGWIGVPVVGRLVAAGWMLLVALLMAGAVVSLLEEGRR